MLDVVKEDPIGGDTAGQMEVAYIIIGVHLEMPCLDMPTSLAALKCYLEWFPLQ